MSRNRRPSHPPRPDWVTLLTAVPDQPELLTAALEKYGPVTLDDALRDVSDAEYPRASARVLASLSERWPISSQGMAGRYERLSEEMTAVKRLLSLLVLSVSPGRWEADQGDLPRRSRGVVALPLLDLGDQLEAALIRSTDEFAPTWLLTITGDLRPVMQRGLSLAELTGLLQHSLEVHRAQQAAGLRFGSSDEQDRRVLRSVGITFFFMRVSDDLFPVAAAAAAAAVGVQAAGDGERNQLVWALMEELGLQDDTAAILQQMGFAGGFGGSVGCLPRLPMSEADLLDVQALLELSSERRDALPWLIRPLLMLPPIDLELAETVLSRADLEDWQDREALQKGGLRLLTCPPKKQSMPGRVLGHLSGHPSGYPSAYPSGQLSDQLPGSGAQVASLPARSNDQFSRAVQARPSRQLAEELATISQVRLGQLLGRVPEAGTPAADAEERLLGWSETLKRRVARLKRS